MKQAKKEGLKEVLVLLRDILLAVVFVLAICVMVYYLAKLGSRSAMSMALWLVGLTGISVRIYYILRS